MNEINKLYNKYKDLLLNPPQFNPNTISDIVNKLYESKGLAHPPIFLLDSPSEEHYSRVDESQLGPSLFKEFDSHRIRSKFAENLIDKTRNGEKMENTDDIKRAVKKFIDLARRVIPPKLEKFRDQTRYYTPYTSYDAMVTIMYVRMYQAMGHTELVSADLDEEVRGLEEMVLCMDQMIPFQNGCVILGRPERIWIDTENLLHNGNGPAIKYNDDALYYWHGTTVPKEWIEDPSSITPKIVFDHPNTEQRRCAIEMVGWEAILAKMDAKTIDKNFNPEIGTLLEVDMPTTNRQGTKTTVKRRFLRVQCGTGRSFCLGVPTEMKTALQANAWTYDVPEESLQKLNFRT